MERSNDTARRRSLRLAVTVVLSANLLVLLFGYTTLFYTHGDLVLFQAVSINRPSGETIETWHRIERLEKWRWVPGPARLERVISQEEFEALRTADPDRTGRLGGIHWGATYGKTR